MRRERLEQWVLLRDAGELDIVRSWLLKRALRRDAELARFEADVQSLAKATRTALPDTPLHPSIKAAILGEAGRAGNAGELSLPPSAAFRPVFALAAVVVLLAAARLVLMQSRTELSTVAMPDATVTTSEPDPAALAWDDGMETAIEALESTLASSSDDWTMSNGSATGSSTESLIEELLSLEESRI